MIIPIKSNIKILRYRITEKRLSQLDCLKNTKETFSEFIEVILHLPNLSFQYLKNSFKKCYR